jgi:hypothetical protein
LIVGAYQANPPWIIAIWVSLIGADNQIIQAIAIDIACAGDWNATSITYYLFTFSLCILYLLILLHVITLCMCSISPDPVTDSHYGDIE